MRRRALAASAALVAAALLLSGCSGSSNLKKVNTMSPDEAIAKQLVPYADAVGKHLDGTWQPDSTLTPEKDGQEGVPCTLPDGKKGRAYAITWYGPGVADPDGTITQVQADWKALGTDVGVVNPNDASLGEARVLSYPAYHTGAAADGYLLTLTMTTKQTSLETQTHCLVKGG